MNAYKKVWESCVWCQTLSCTHRQDKGQWHKLQHRKFHTNRREIFAVRVTVHLNKCEFSFSGDIQNLPGRFPGEPTVGNML